MRGLSLHERIHRLPCPRLSLPYLLMTGSTVCLAFRLSLDDRINFLPSPQLVSLSQGAAGAYICKASSFFDQIPFFTPFQILFLPSR